MIFNESECRKIIDDVYEYGRDWNSYPGKLKLRFFRLHFHLFLCSSCSGEIEKLDFANDVLHRDFFPPAPSFEDAVMKQISEEKILYEANIKPVQEVPGWFSFRTWIIVGFFILISLAVTFLSVDFVTAAFTNDSSFMALLGITTGMLLTGYGALFIGSHLKKLSNHFKLQK